jgi:hypothetical protein
MGSYGGPRGEEQFLMSEVPLTIGSPAQHYRLTLVGGLPPPCMQSFVGVFEK